VNSLSFISRGAILLIGASTGVYLLSAPDAPEENLISNPGFELRRGNAPAGWRLSPGAAGNTFDWVGSSGVADEVHAGERALRMNAVRPAPPEQSMDVVSNPFRVPPLCRVEASVWLKAADVVGQGDAGWYGLRVTLTARNAFGVRIEHRDLLSEQGSFAWKKIRGGMTVPEGTATMDLAIKLTTCTGTVWVDEAEVRVVKELPAVNLDGISSPILIPRPWQSRMSGDKFPMQSVLIEHGSEDPRVQEAVASFFTSLGVPYKFRNGPMSVWEHYATQLILGDPTDPALAREFSERFPDAAWSDLEEQGYFLAVVRGEVQTHIYIGANRPIGRFYALQTLRQLVENGAGAPIAKFGDGDPSVYAADILDKPTIAWRGIPMGLQWFEQRKGEALQRLTQSKFNFVWVQGSFLDHYLDADNWRLDLTDLQKMILREFIELYRHNFIDVWIAIGPRGKRVPLQHSSHQDIDTIVRKMDVLYSLGLRHFGLRFDDLGNVGEDRLLVPQDSAIFHDDIGAAQVYLIYEVYARLKARHPDIQFMVVPMDYSLTGNYGGTTRAGLRLQQFRKLPPEIGIYMVSYYDEDILTATGLTGRPHVAVVSNFYAEGLHDNNEYAIPFLNFIGWHDAAVRARIAGFTWLPKIPQSEDAALISWRTAADFAWAPERYEPNRSFQLAAAKYLGVPQK
jgi:hypothetical protein